MADVNLPSFSELGQMEFMSPMAFQQAQNQMGLANQFQQQNLAMGQEDLRAKALANMFSEQSNPLKINKLGLENEGMGYENTVKQVEADTAAALKEENIMAKRQKMLAELDENKLKQFMSRAEMEMMSDDPKLQASGQKKIMMSKAELDRRNKQQDELAKIAAQGQNSLAVANVGAAATRYSADKNAASRQALAAAKGQGASDIYTALRTGKMTPDKAAIAAYALSEVESDPVERERLLGIAKVAEGLVQNKAAASKVGTPDIGAMANVPTIQPQSAIPSRAVGGAVGQPAQPVTSNVPQGAIEMLKKNPALRQKFDEKYGAGASKSVLGN